MSSPSDEYIKGQREGDLDKMAKAEEHAREQLHRAHIERGLTEDTAPLHVEILMEMEFELEGE